MSGWSSIQSPQELHRHVLSRIWSCLSRSAASPIICVFNLVPLFELSDRPLSVFPRSLDSDIISMDRSADSTRLVEVQARARFVPCTCPPSPRSLQARIPSLEQRHGCRTSSFSAAHTADCLVLLRLRPEARCITKNTVPFWLHDAASEMTSFTSSRCDVALNKSGLVQCCVPSRPSEILCSDTRTFPCLCQPGLSWWGSQVEGPDLCSTCQPVAEDSQIPESRFSRRLVPSTFLAICGLFVRQLTRFPSRLSLALPSAWKTSCLHSKRFMHGRESCNALPLRSCKNQAPLLICSSSYKTTQSRMHLPHPMTSFCRFLRISHNISR